MKTISMNKLSFSLYLLRLLVFTVASCKDDDASPGFTSVEINENFPDCNVNSSRIRFFENAKGIVIRTQSDIDPFTVEGMPNSGWNTSDPLVPFHLPDEVQQDGLEITFSGHLYENLPGADATGVVFEFTELKTRAMLSKTKGLQQGGMNRVIQRSGVRYWKRVVNNNLTVSLQNYKSIC